MLCSNCSPSTTRRTTPTVLGPDGFAAGKKGSNDAGPRSRSLRRLASFHPLLRGSKRITQLLSFSGSRLSNQSECALGWKEERRGTRIGHLIALGLRSSIRGEGEARFVPFCWYMDVCLRPSEQGGGRLRTSIYI